MADISTLNSFNAYGFVVDEMEENLDMTLPNPFEGKHNTSFTFSSLGKLHRKSDSGNKVYKYDYKSVMLFTEMCQQQVHEEKVHKITQRIGSKFTRRFDSFRDTHKYAVKVMKASTYRCMVAGLKEASMTNEVFSVCNGIVSKPFFSAPFWNGKQWCYVIITAFITGKTLKEQKECIKNDVVSIIHSLWWNGYSHNNLQKRNVIYNKRNGVFTLVGMSKCVGMSHQDTCTFRRNVVEFNVPFNREYQDTFKEKSLRLAKYAAVYGKGNVIETDDIAITSLIL